MAPRKSRFGRNLSQLIEAASAHYLRLFLASCKTPDDDLLQPPEISGTAAESDAATKDLLKLYLDQRDQEVLGELDRLCASVLELSEGKGITSLNTVAAQKLLNTDHDQFVDAPDPLCRSILVHSEFPDVFRDAESFHAARRYRDHRKLYAAFEIDQDDLAEVGSLSPDVKVLCEKLEQLLELKAKATASVLELPETADHPPSLLIAIRHPGALSSIQDHRTDGGLMTYYYRPSREAVLIFTPGQKKIEVCAESFEVRTTVAETFAEVVLQQDLSAKPLTRRDFNLERFRESLNLDLPDLEPVEVTGAAVVEAEMPLGHWGRRLTLKVTKDEDIEKAMTDYIRGGNRLVRKFGFAKIVIAVDFVHRGDGKKGTLRLQVSGGNTSNVQSQRDTFLRDLGFTLLSHWGLMNQIRPLTEHEEAKWFRFLLSLYDLTGDEVSGSFFSAANVDPNPLIETGFLERKPRQVLVLIDDEDDGTTEGELATGPEKGTLRQWGGFGEPRGVIPKAQAIAYRLNRPWLGERILKTLGGVLGSTSLQIEDAHLASLGKVDLAGVRVPIYLVRGLDDTKVLDQLDIALRQKHKSGPGVVLCLSDHAPRYLGPNVVVNVTNVLSSTEDSVQIDEHELRRLFDAGRTLVSAAQVAQVVRQHAHAGSLVLPGKDPLTLTTANQLDFFECLVTAAQDGSSEVLTKVLMDGMSSDHPKQLFSGKKWDIIWGTYLRHGSTKRYWRLASGVRDLIDESSI
ncbi:hypothetical protein [Roseovarius sp. Pro17]|uniref:hypothetical protein n=1 Tax=Roseovarius sp. Pro17 TaxID=3108175 RepID=UPI002D76FD76|nr:hypothetical protein [Roseovarius sp. Pro17]